MQALAIDIGGTKIAFGVYNEQHEVLKHWQVPTPESAADIDAAFATAYFTAVSDCGPITAIGISAAGNVKEDGRTMTFSANIPAWINYPLADRLEALINHACPVIVENDANSAGWGEYICGAGAGSRNMVMLTVGTGLGGAFVLDGHLFRGSFGMAAEVGHFPMIPDGQACGCGLFGCAETYVSGTALEQYARSAVRRSPQEGERLLELASGDITNLTGLMVSQAAHEGDKLALQAFEKTGEWLGRVMAAISAMLDPDRYVIGGGVASVGDILLEPARKSYAHYLEAAVYRPHARIVEAQADGDAGLVGVADLAVRAVVQ